MYSLPGYKLGRRLGVDEASDRTVQYTYSTVPYFLNYLERRTIDVGPRARDPFLSSSVLSPSSRRCRTTTMMRRDFFHSYYSAS